jgi:branched-chain amino acid transport system substrate-binding protein
MKKLIIVALVGWALIGIGSGAQQTPGVSANEIVLGAFVAQSGALAGVGIPVVRGASTYYTYVNDTLGGVNGRKIRFVTCDDAFDPTKTVACVKKLVEEDKVFAIVNSLGTVPHAAVMEYLIKNNVPVVSPHANYTPFSKPVKNNYFRDPAQQRDLRHGARPLCRTAAQVQEGRCALC